jgi:hypothetical protein
MPVWVSAVETQCLAVRLFSISFSENPEVLEELEYKKDVAPIPNVYSSRLQLVRKLLCLVDVKT